MPFGKRTAPPIRHLLIGLLLCLVSFLILIAPTLFVRAQDSGCPVGEYECLRLTAICSQQWRVTNPNNIPVEAYWQIWSAYEYTDDPPIILYEGLLNLRPRQTLTFRTPVARPVVVVWGTMGGGAGPLDPSTRPCASAPPRTCTDIFKIIIPPELRPAGAQFVIYNVGGEFLDTYTDDDLGFDIQMGAIRANGQVSLLLCQDAWPGPYNFVGMVESGGTRTPVIEFALTDAYPEILVVWTAPGVSNAQ